MKRDWVALLVLTLCPGAASRSGGRTTEARADETPAAAPSTGVAVVELFTSEGCSSCPPADDVLGELARSRTPARPVYALAFHVDYWDDLGWPDPFASPDNTARQQMYALAFGARGLYTPQMVVNGVEPFNGSDRARATRSVARALAQPAPVSLTVRARADGEGVIAVDYEVANAMAGATLDVAVVERSASSEVRAGENMGRTLRHANPVRAFATIALARPAGSVRLRLPASMGREDGEVIAYVQRPAGPGGGMPVGGATRAPLPR